MGVSTVPGVTSSGVTEMSEVLGASFGPCGWSGRVVCGYGFGGECWRIGGGGRRQLRHCGKERGSDEDGGGDDLCSVHP